ncbi:MAG: putative rane protein [Firmicutes bacterium]|nr:putative rane protein [Bacillota bacterium]
MTKNKKWYDYLWILSAAYMVLGFVNIMSAWLGLICFLVPVLISAVKGNKSYCSRYCGRGQLFDLLGSRFNLSRRKDIPAFLRSKWFRYGFLLFFMAMFANMIFMTYLVFRGAGSLKEVVTLLWAIRMPWDWAYGGGAAAHWAAHWAAQFAFGFYSLMLTSTTLGLITMAMYKPRSWCVYCPMGTMTQGICRLKDAA